MIAPARRRHRWMSATLLVALPVLVVVSLRARPPRYYMESLPADMVDEGFEGGESYDVFGARGVGVRGIEAAGGALLELVPAAPLAKPDVLVYWSSEQPAGEAWLDGATLLGALGDRPRSYFLPPEAATADGHLVLYSLAHREVEASGRLPAIAEPLPEVEKVPP